MRPDIERLLGESPAFLRTLEHVSLVAPLEKPVLIVGERGTGKELIASRLHFLSNRWESQFIKMNCAAISESLLETELFGHDAGAFTGATKTHHGRFERAHGGTLFLDELATTSMLVQEKLLRVIEYGEFERVGGSKTLTCDVRIIAATNEDLPALAAKGEFRADLLDRLAFDVLTLPPLREREEDILLLANHFAVSMATELGRELFAGFNHAAQRELLAYAWPGNVRELKNVVERCVYRTDPDSEVEEVVFDPFSSPYRPEGKAPAGEDNALPVQPNAAALPIELKQHIADYEISLLEKAMQEAKHNQRKAADLLGLTYHQFRGYLKKYNLVGSSSDSEDD
ncbi:MAG: phage shock protein operon transcriptional activator [Pseudomonadaceae bacterium]|nr:phage shock protein operon transcriptional activator [Pseudomonadaceae bacterium]